MNSTSPLTAEHLEPWNGNVVDLTMLDGTHRIGLLQRVDAQFVRLTVGHGKAKLPDKGMVQIDQAASIVRASRN
jgi:hypothetical protein